MSIAQPKPAWAESYVAHISNLRKSPSTMNPSSQSKTTLNIQNGAYEKTYKFITQNSTWSIDSLYAYCRDMYTPIGFTPTLFSECIKRYIEQKFSI